MNGYEYSTGSPFSSRGNGSAYELLNMNPALLGIGPFATQQNPTFTTPFGSMPGTQHSYGQQINPWFQQQQNPGWQQQYNPFWQQQTTQPWQTQLNPQGIGNWPQQQYAGLGTGPNMQTQMLTGTPGVYTTKAIDLNVTIPAQTVLGRHPMEVQQYVLQVIVPTLIDALTKRAIAHDVGQSVSYEARGGCVTRVGI